MSDKVVHCKDCAHWKRYDLRPNHQTADIYGVEMHECERWDIYHTNAGKVPVTSENFYCAFGEEIKEAAKADLNKSLEKYSTDVFMFEFGYKTAKSEIVHCKDCKHWPYQLLPYSENTTADPTYQHCFDFKSDGYCSLGRRKEE